MLLLRLITLACVIQFSLSASAGAAAEAPSRYSIAQQVGATCFVSCWHNFKFIQDVRAKNGGQFLVAAASSKTRYEWFLETSGIFADWYKIFRIQSGMKGSAFADFIYRVMTTSITVKDAVDYVSNLDSPIDQRASASLFPHLLSSSKESLVANYAYLPTDDPIVMLNLGVSLSGVVTTQINVSVPQPVPLLGHTLYFVPSAMLAGDRVFYDFGLYKLMLMAAKVNSINQIVADSATDTESLEILQLHKAMKASDNPWKDISLDHFLEYRVANLLMNNAPLKKQVEAVVDVFYKTFGFYKDAKKLGLSSKMGDLPSEDQMLAYCFCNSLRKLSASSMSEAAVIAVLELKDNEVDPICDLIGCKISEFFRAKFYEPQKIDDDKYVNFASIWGMVKKALKLESVTEMVTFDGHGAVLSFDPKLIALQKFTDKDLAQELGFVIMDASYAKGMKPFYQFGEEE